LLAAANQAAAQTVLGLVPGTDVQAYDATLASIAALGTAANKILYTTGVDTWAESDLTAFIRTVLDDANATEAKTTLEVITGSTGSMRLPSGTTAQRDGSPSGGYIRFNSDDNKYEGYFNAPVSDWQELGGGQMLGNAATKAIFYNAQTIDEDITIGATQNGLSAGPITISATYTVTINAGGVWVIV
jgi:hypothetical protein